MRKLTIWVLLTAVNTGLLFVHTSTAVTAEDFRGIDMARLQGQTSSIERSSRYLEGYVNWLENPKLLVILDESHCGSESKQSLPELLERLHQSSERLSRARERFAAYIVYTKRGISPPISLPVDMPIPDQQP